MEDIAIARTASRAPAPAAAAGPCDLRDWLARVERLGQLQRISASVDAEEELAAITYMAARDENSPALLFQSIAGSPGARILTNMLGASRTRFALAMGLDPALPLPALIRATRDSMARRLPPVMVASEEAPVNAQVLTGAEVDLTALPAPKFWPRDGGRYLGTGDITFTRDPDSGRINAGVYRQMLHGKTRVGLYCSPGKHGRLDREAWWKRGQPCEVVAAYGIDPVLFMVGAQSFGVGQSELDVAGGIMGRPVELTRGVAVGLPIPARAEIVIEGLLHPGDTEMEGPLGEFTGYYGNVRAPQPVIEVKALHMRENPIVTAALMADYPACEIGAYYAIMRSARVLDDLETIGVPGICGVYAHPAAASGWGMLVVSLRQQYAGHVAQVLALAAQCPAAAYYTKWIVAVDDDVDPTDLDQVLFALSTRCNPIDDIDIQRNTWSTGLDPSQFVPEKRPYGSKALINACKPHRHLKEFPARTMLRRSVYERVCGRWRELGLSGTPPALAALDESGDSGKT
jgi:4-hydroxy-3-polyprenylbenzoate decarboxylase